MKLLLCCLLVLIHLLQAESHTFSRGKKLQASVKLYKKQAGFYSAYGDALGIAGWDDRSSKTYKRVGLAPDGAQHLSLSAGDVLLPKSSTKNLSWSAATSLVGLRKRGILKNSLSDTEMVSADGDGDDMDITQSGGSEVESGDDAIKGRGLAEGNPLMNMLLDIQRKKQEQEREALENERLNLKAKKLAKFHGGANGQLQSIIKNIDVTFDPCTDFYSFSCNGWRSEKIRASKDGKSQHFMQEKTYDIENDIMTEFFKGFPRTSGLLKAPYERLTLRRLTKQMRSMFDSCRDVDKLNRAGIAALQPYLDEIMSANLETPQGLGKAMGSLVKLDVFTVFGNHLSTTDKPNSLMLVFNPGNLLFREDAYSSHTTKLVYSRMVTLMIQLFGLTPKDGTKSEVWIANKMFDFEQALSKSIKAGIRRIKKTEKSAGRALQEDILQWTTIERLQKQFGQVVNIREYFRAAGYKQKVDKIALVDALTMVKLSDILKETNSEVIRAYMAVSLLLKFKDELPPRLFDGVSLLYHGVGKGAALTAAGDAQEAYSASRFPSTASNSDSRVELCYHVVREHFSVILERFFVDRSISDGITDRALQYTSLIKEALKNRIQKSEWLDSWTRRHALVKLHKMDTEHVVYPSWLKDDTTLAEMYDYKVDWDYYLGSKINITLEDYAADIDQFYNPVEGLSSSQLNAFDLNAHYYPTKNKLAVGQAIFHEPLFGKDGKCPNVDFGAAGSIIGHEMSHGFDVLGRLRDHNGKLGNWWSKKTEVKYNAASKCFSDYYGKTRVLAGPETYAKVDGIKTLGENVAE